MRSKHYFKVDFGDGKAKVRVKDLNGLEFLTAAATAMCEWRSRLKDEALADPTASLYPIAVLNFALTHGRLPKDEEESENTIALLFETVDRCRAEETDNDENEEVNNVSD